MLAHAPRSAAVVQLFRWAGALLFLISVGYFLFAYLFTFGAVSRGPIGPALTWNVAVFTFFAMHHSAFARAPVRRWISATFGAELERPCYVWVASVLFIVVCASWRPVAGVAWDADGVVLWMLRIAQATGVWLMLRSAAILDIRELAGLRTSLGLAPTQDLVPEFKTHGPYRWIRHPIYSGWFLFVFTASPMTMTRLTFAIVSSAYLLVAIPLEERSMRAASRGAYDRYIAQVPWRLVPGLYQLFVVIVLW